MSQENNWLFNYEEPAGLVNIEPREAAEMICGRIPPGYEHQWQSQTADYFQDGKRVLETFYGVSFDATNMLRVSYVDHSVRSRVFHPLGIKVDPREINTMIAYVGEIARTQTDVPQEPVKNRVLKK